MRVNATGSHNKTLAYEVLRESWQADARCRGNHGALIQRKPWQCHGGHLVHCHEPPTMPYTLSEAAAACGINRSTVLRALKSGKISGTRDEAARGMSMPPSYTGFLHPLHPPRHRLRQCRTRPYRCPDPAAQAALCDMRQQRADAMADRDKWREAFENQQRLALPLPGQEPLPAQPDATPEPATAWQRWWRWRRAG